MNNDVQDNRYKSNWIHDQYVIHKKENLTCSMDDVMICGSTNSTITNNVQKEKKCFDIKWRK